MKTYNKPTLMINSYKIANDKICADVISSNIKYESPDWVIGAGNGTVNGLK